MFLMQGVWKHYGSKAAIADINLDLAPQKTHILVGTSGSGKSTLLRAMLGLITHDRGQIQFDGTTVTNEARLEIVQRIGYVVQEGGLFPHLSCRKNTTLVAELRGWSKERIQNRINELAELVSLPTSLLDRYPQQLSGGQRQRVAIARATITEPSVLLADEPTGNLDQKSGQDVIQTLEALNDRGITLIVVTHDGQLGRRAARRIRMTDGRIEKDQTG